VTDHPVTDHPVTDHPVTDHLVTDHPVTGIAPVTIQARRRALLLALIGGLATTASVPPFGWWPLGIVGIGLLAAALHGTTWRRRLVIGLVWGVALYGPSLWWMTQFSLPGGVIVALLQTAHVGVAMTLVRTHTKVALAFTVPAAIVAHDATRSLWPFGGLPLGGIDLGQAAGPLAPVVGWGGRLGLILVTSMLGCGLWLVTQHRARNHARMGAAFVVGCCVLTVLCRVVPNGTHPFRSMRVAAVQGGGPRGQRATEANADRTYRAHLAATATLREKVDLVLWPEDVFDVAQLRLSRTEADLANVARRTSAIFLPGGVEDVGTGGFRNFSVVFEPNGFRGNSYQKVRRVPYGEYFWARSLIEKYNLAPIPARDAVAGKGPGVVRTKTGTFAIAISYEGFFDDRSRGGVRAGGEALLIPTNASSYRTAQIPSQQIAAARLRARETGRWVVQAAPTGFSGVLDDRGRLLVRSRLGEQRVLVQTIWRRRGLTPYARWNDVPALMSAALCALAGWIASVLARRQRIGSEDPCDAS
jgi:apolipoprotein N-acyltransferase